MDEEDLADADEAQALQTNEAFSGLGLTGEDAKRRGGLLDVFKNEGETMGVKLLRKMGWRDGHGVGPRVRRRAIMNDSTKVMDDTHGEHLFAPTNSKMIRFHRNDDHKGLGYAGEARLAATPAAQQPGSDSEDGRASPARNKALSGPIAKSGQRNGRFGVGVLNDGGSDDEDEFAVGPRMSYNRTIGGDKKSKKTSNISESNAKAANPLVKSKPVFRSKSSLLQRTGFRRGHDGKPPLDGFQLSDSMKALNVDGSTEHYAPPPVPEDWVSAKTPSAEGKATFQSTADAAKSSKLDAKARAAILGEAQLPGKSIFDFMSTSARDRVAYASGKTNLPSALGEQMPGVSRSATAQAPPTELPCVEKSVALSALGRGVGGWMPYAEDEAKRQRYRAFIEYHADVRKEAPQRPASIMNDRWSQELREFAHAAEVFKPISGVMASRFATASSGPKGGTEDKTEGKLQATNNSARAKESADPAEEAASMGLFGPLTRSVHQFFPTRLLCKRFNVKLPAHVEAENQGEADRTGGVKVKSDNTASASESLYQTSDLLSQRTMDQMRAHTQQVRSTGPQQIEGPPGGNTTTEISHSTDKGPAEVDASRNTALEGQRAGDAVFKAIFGSDDDDSD